MAMLRHIPTGRLYHYSDYLWQRGDMEEVTEEQLIEAVEEEVEAAPVEEDASAEFSKLDAILKAAEESGIENNVPPPVSKSRIRRAK